MSTQGRSAELAQTRRTIGYPQNNTVNKDSCFKLLSFGAAFSMQ